MDKQYIITYLKSKQKEFYDKFGIKIIGIFGSFSRNKAKPLSDIDILYEIETNKKLSIFKYLIINKELEDFFYKKIDLIRFETLKPEIKNYIIQDLIYV